MELNTFDAVKAVAPEPTGPPGDPLASVVQKLPPILRASRFGLVILGTLYTVGLIIVNVDLARYGLISVDLARAEYIMTGSLWAFLMVTTLAASDFFFRRAKAWLKRPIKAKDVLYMGVDFLFVWLTFFTVVGFLSRDDLGVYRLFVGRATLAYVALLSCGFSLYVAIDSFGGVLRAEMITLGTLFSKSGSFKTAPIYAFFLLLSSLGLYAIAVHSHFAREFGGGKRSAVFLVPSDTSAMLLSTLPLPRRDGRIGPVMLLVENENMYLVKPMEESSKCCERRAVGIDKKLIGALITAPNFDADQQTTGSHIAVPRGDEIFL